MEIRMKGERRRKEKDGERVGRREDKGEGKRRREEKDRGGVEGEDWWEKEG